MIVVTDSVYSSFYSSTAFTSAAV